MVASPSKGSFFLNYKSLMKMTKEDAMTDKLSIPREMIFKELMDATNNMDRLIKSSNGRLLMCNKVVIQLSEDLE